MTLRATVTLYLLDEKISPKKKMSVKRDKQKRVKEGKKEEEEQ